MFIKDSLEEKYLLGLEESDAEFSSTTEKDISLPGKELIELIRLAFARGACFRMRVKGFSMSPFVRNSDVVTIAPLCQTRISRGSIAAFVNPKTGQLIIHRVVGKNRKSYLIKGDNAPRVDSLIPEDSILGCLTKIERNGRNVSFGLAWERSIVALLSRARVWYLALRIFRLLPLPIRNSVKSML
jgi:hypothetical protein